MADRLLFSKTGRAKYISHLDLMRTFQRAFARAGSVFITLLPGNSKRLAGGYVRRRNFISERTPSCAQSPITRYPASWISALMALASWAAVIRPCATCRMSSGGRAP